MSEPQPDPTESRSYRGAIVARHLDGTEERFPVTFTVVPDPDDEGDQPEA